jgi:hypothetical protein
VSRRAGEGAAGLALLLVVTLVGCAAGGRSGGAADGSGGGADRDARNKAESDAVDRALRTLPGVVRVDGGYTRDVSNAGGAVVLSVTVRPGTDLGHVADEAVRRVWLSRLDPVTSMTVTVGPDGDPAGAIDRHADFRFDRDQLTSTYGPRPPG